MGFIPDMQVCSHIEKMISVIGLINGIKKRNHMVTKST